MELGSISGGAFEPDASAVHFDDLASDRQTQTCVNPSVETIGGLCWWALITDEQTIIEIGRHAGAVVFHHDLDKIGIGPGGHRHLAPGRRVFRRVAKQNREDLGNLVAVA